MARLILLKIMHQTPILVRCFGPLAQVVLPSGGLRALPLYFLQSALILEDLQREREDRKEEVGCNPWQVNTTHW